MNQAVREFFQPSDLTPSEQRYHLNAQLMMLGGLLCHATLLAYFSYFEVWFLFYFNIGSVIWFVTLMLIIRYRHYLLATLLVPVEILIHQVACVMILGWGAGFQYFLITNALASFLVIRGYLIQKLVVAMISVLSFMTLSYLHADTWSTGLLPDVIVTWTNQAVFLMATGLLIAALWLFSKRLESYELQLQAANDENERLLYNILPPSIADDLKNQEGELVERFESASILFADIVGFTKWAAESTPAELVDILNGLFTRFDDRLDEFGLEKIKTIGDAYMVAAGVPHTRSDHAGDLMRFALLMLTETEQFNREHGTDLHIRIGISSGPVVAGVIGHKKFAYDLWGDTVNTAARMEQCGLDDKIQVSEATYELLKDRHQFAGRDDVEIKGKGRMNTYILSNA